MLQFTKQIKEEWLSALKSGTYKQGFAELHTEEDNSYCCIGVFEKINNTSDKTYSIMDKMLGEDKVREIWILNDNKQYRDSSNCPRNYSNVIPLIEQLETVE